MALEAGHTRSTASGHDLKDQLPMHRLLKFGYYALLAALIGAAFATFGQSLVGTLVLPWSSAAAAGRSAWWRTAGRRSQRPRCSQPIPMGSP